MAFYPNLQLYVGHMLSFFKYFVVVVATYMHLWLFVLLVVGTA